MEESLFTIEKHDKEIILTKCSTEVSGNIVIPEGVTIIGTEAFDSCSKIQSITIPNGVHHIKPFAFSDCTRLTSIFIPDSVVKISRCAFEGCVRLSDVSMPGFVEIGIDAFKDCRCNDMIWESYDRPTKGTYIHRRFGKALIEDIIQDAIDDHHEIVDNPNDIDKIHKAFESVQYDIDKFFESHSFGLLSDNKLSLWLAEQILWRTSTDTIKYLLDQRFWGNDDFLKRNDGFTWYHDNKKTPVSDLTILCRLYFCQNEKALWDIYAKGIGDIEFLFQYYPNGMDYVFLMYLITSSDPSYDPFDIPNSTNEIRKAAIDLLARKYFNIYSDDFFNCWNYYEIKKAWETGLKVIRQEFVRNEESIHMLKNILNEDNKEDWNFWVAEDEDGNKELTRYNRESYGTIDIEPGINIIGKNAFSYCEHIHTINLPDSITEIHSGAFQYCSLLKEIVFPPAVKTIESFTFAHCHNITNLIIPSTIKKICSAAFEDCVNIKTVTIEGHDTAIAKFGFGTIQPKELHLTFYEKIKTINSWFYDDLKDCILYVPRECFEKYNEDKDKTSFKDIVIK